MKTIVEIDHAYAHDISMAPHLNQLLGYALVGNHDDAWKKLESFGLRRVDLKEFPASCDDEASGSGSGAP